MIRFQLRRQIGIQVGRRRSVRESRIASEDHAGTFAAEGELAGRHLVQHRSEREQVRARIQFLRPHLLRRHVGHRPYGSARGWSDALPASPSFAPALRLAARFADRLRHLRQPEIQNLRVSALGDKDVRRLDVAVDDSRRVRGIQRVGNLDPQRQNGLGLHRPPADAVLQRHPVEILHHQEGLLAVLADLVNGADVGMVQTQRRRAPRGGSAPGLAGPCATSSGQELQSHEAAEFGVLGLVDHTHAAPAELLDDAVVRDGLADHLSFLAVSGYMPSSLWFPPLLHGVEDLACLPMNKRDVKQGLRATPFASPSGPAKAKSAP